MKLVRSLKDKASFVFHFTLNSFVCVLFFPVSGILLSVLLRPKKKKNEKANN